MQCLSCFCLYWMEYDRELIGNQRRERGEICNNGSDQTRARDVAITVSILTGQQDAPTLFIFNNYSKTRICKK